MEENKPVTPKSFSVKKYAAVILASMVLFTLGFVASYFLTKHTTPTFDNSQFVKRSEDWKLPLSRKQGIPIQKLVKDGNYNLYIYSLEQNKFLKVENVQSGNGGASGSGGVNPIASPNLLYTAYIDTLHNHLYIISNETLLKTEIPTSPNVAYITSWSPDSKTIVYQVAGDSIIDRTRGMGLPDYSKMKSEIFTPKLEAGFHAYNIETGEDKWLYPLSEVETFINNDQLMSLVNISDDNTNLRLVSFNINSFEANYSLTNDNFGFGTGQYRFSQDGKKWTFISSNHPTDDMNITYADFPNKTGVVVDSGKWADVQWPVLSPNGDKLAYISKVSGLVIYDTHTQQKTSMGFSGSPKFWVDNSQLVTNDYDDSVKDWHSEMVNITTHQVKDLYPR